MQCLAQQMSRLRVSRRPQAFASHKNGLCGQKLAAQPMQQVSAVTQEIVCGKTKKVKTRKAVAKRFTVSGTGKIMRRKPGKQHINEKMSRSHIRKLGKMNTVDQRDVANIAPNLPYSGVRQSKNS